MSVPDLKWLYERAAGLSARWDLSAIALVLAAMDYPQRRFPVVLVAGTNGKGSTCAALEGILSEHYACVGLYTSPHLNTIYERIRTQRQNISHEKWLGAQEALWRAEKTAGIALRFFECLTVMAFWFFAQKKVDMAIVEVGLGGRLDATNVCEPLCSVIGPIAFDHTEILGDYIAAIAREKAGIMRKGCPVVLGHQTYLEAWGSLLREAHQKNAYPVVVDMQHPLPEPQKKLPLFLQHNLKLAATTAHVLGVPLPSILKGLATFAWPGRFEWLTEDILLDGAHNEHAVAALSESICRHPLLRKTRWHICIGTLADKDTLAMLRHLQPLALQIYGCLLPHPRSHTLRSWQDWAERVANLKCYSEASSAFKHAEAARRPGEKILITGSLSLVGLARYHFMQIPYDSRIDA
jgi:dihydrofolate synthase/folylpolyglutamate synthase